MQTEKVVKKTKKIPCPNCKKMAEFSSNNRFRPFCSERCKMIDLGDWANERYRIPDKSPPKNSDDPS